MKMRLAVFSVFAAVCHAGAAQAGVVTLAPDPCPAPAAAEPYRPGPDVSAEDFGVADWRFLGPVLYDADASTAFGETPWLRFYLDPETGLPAGAPPDLLTGASYPISCGGAAPE